MKIGILTLHRALNYGAVLQTMGLYNYLKKMNYFIMQQIIFIIMLIIILINI